MAHLFHGLVVVGILLVVTGLAMRLASSDNLAERMPTQVPPPWLARRVMAAGAVLAIVGLVGSIAPR